VAKGAIEALAKDRTATELEQVVSIIRSLKSIDQQGQELLAREEEKMVALLQEVNDHIKNLEAEARQQLEVSLEQAREQLAAVNQAAIQAAQEEYATQSSHLETVAATRHASWVAELVSRCLTINYP